MPTPNRWVYVVLTIFVLTLMIDNPDAAAQQVREMTLEPLGGLIRGTFDFIDELLGSDLPQAENSVEPGKGNQHAES